jgi:hypothetical protein
MGASALLGGGAKQAFTRNTAIGGLAAGLKKKQIPPSGNMGGFGPQPAAGAFINGHAGKKIGSYL